MSETAQSPELPDYALELFQGKNFAFLATIGHDGSPQVTPVWVHTDGTYILINTAIGRVKQRNVTRDPRVAVSLVDHGNPYRMVAVKGRVVEQITGAAADNHIDNLNKKYTGRDRFQRRQGERRVILKIVAERIARMG